METTETTERSTTAQSEPAKLKMLITQDGVVFVEVADEE